MTGFHAVLPTMLGIGAWGLVTGVAMVKAGMSVPLAIYMSLTVYAGSAQLAVLPENFALMGQREGDKLAVREAEGQGPIQDFLAEQAARHRLWLVGGTIPLQAVGDDRRVRAAGAAR